MLYSSSDPVDRDQVIDPNSYLPFKLVDSIIVTRIMKEMDDLGDPQEEGYCPAEPSISSTHDLVAPTSLVGALTKALCCKESGIEDSATHSSMISPDVNRITTSSPPTGTSKSAETIEAATLPEPRILILSVSQDLATSYIPIMNAIFSAQKLVS